MAKSELISIKGCGEKIAEKLNALGIFTLQDLIEYFPSKYIDFSVCSSVNDESVGEYVLVSGTITSFRGEKNYYSKVDVINATVLCDGGGVLSVSFFNQSYLKNKIFKGSRYRFFGKVESFGEIYKMVNPIVEDVNRETRFKGIFPIYKTKGLVPLATFQKLVKEAFNMQCFYSVESVYAGLSSEENIDDIGLKNLLTSLHFPNDGDDTEKNRALYMREKAMQKLLSFRIFKENNTIKGYEYFGAEKAVEEFKRRLPFELTPSQRQAVDVVVSDMNKPFAMNRLVSGDVGSGKTAVAFCAMAYAAGAGHQAALICPKEILARQHYMKAVEIFDGIAKVEMLTSSVKGAQRKRIFESVKNHETDIVIGTTALLNEGLDFDDLTLAVIDESHLFGVATRAGIEHKGRKTDTLVMTATPIPREVALTMYGELDDTFVERRIAVDEVISTVVSSSEETLYKKIEEEVALGHQAYVVCPAVTDCEGIEMASATATAQKLIEGRLSHCRVGLIHGKLNQTKKNEIMDGFYKGEIDVLVSTTVVEVGIDCPRATVMGVLNSERFGLATLHQLRGRVGRSGLQSFCYLITKNATNKRLTDFSYCKNGLEIAELDFHLRGAGDYIGLRQSGDEGDSALNCDEKDLKEIKILSEKYLCDKDFVEKFIQSPLYKTDGLIEKIVMN